MAFKCGGRRLFPSPIGVPTGDRRHEEGVALTAAVKGQRGSNLILRSASGMVNKHLWVELILKKNMLLSLSISKTVNAHDDFSNVCKI